MCLYACICACEFKLYLKNITLKYSKPEHFIWCDYMFQNLEFHFQACTIQVIQVILVFFNTRWIFVLYFFFCLGWRRPPLLVVVSPFCTWKLRVIGQIWTIYERFVKLLDVQNCSSQTEKVKEVRKIRRVDSQIKTCVFASSNNSLAAWTFRIFYYYQDWIMF